jgi:hypothetical protein
MFHLCDLKYFAINEVVPVLIGSVKTTSDNGFIDILVPAMSATKNEEQARIIVSNVFMLTNVPVIQIVRRLSNLIKGGNLAIRRFLLNYPAVSLFQLLINHDSGSREAGELLLMSIFSENATSQEMEDFLEIMMRHLERVSSNPRVFYVDKLFVPGTAFSEHNFLLLRFLKIIVWFLQNLQSNNIKYFNVLINLFDSFSEISITLDAHLGCLAEAFSFFPIELIENRAIPIFSRIFANSNLILDDHPIAEVFVNVWKFLKRFELSIWKQIILDRQFPIVFAAIASSQLPILESAKRFFLDLLNSETSILIAAFDRSFDRILSVSFIDFAPLFLKIVSVAPHRLIIKIILWIFLFIGNCCTTELFQNEKVSRLLQILQFGLQIVHQIRDIEFNCVDVDPANLVDPFVSVSNIDFQNLYCSWIQYWVKAIPQLHDLIFEQFESNFNSDKFLGTQLGIGIYDLKFGRCRLVDRWLLFEMNTRFDIEKIVWIVNIVRRKSKAALKTVFKIFEEEIERNVNDRIIELAIQLTVTSFHEGFVNELGSGSFYRFGIGYMDADQLIGVFLNVIEGITELETSNERDIVYRVSFMVSLRPELRDFFIELFPIQKEDVIKEVFFERPGNPIPHVSEPSSDSDDTGLLVDQ